ncbi:plastocyanin/azurin family copper-binding protein [Rhizobium mongolense]|uniref:Plastocyanin n=1 Tax=Rhizobium mongolense TaxID=57676 RepID=A0A7W6WDD9_9HYPH|nr:plastocyanin/azurin family copper-binding protein [Rhizobium mongolense]MBB4273428.1 plastocyanin [Rhizobium mongolense]
MKIARRDVLGLGGGLVAALSLFRREVWGEEVVEIRMQGRADGSHVWFDPIGVLVMPGQMVRWINLNPGNSHTTTAYHPANFGRPLRIPEAAKSWASDYLLPDESFSVTFTAQGVYDYYCIPHEHAGMVGRIIVGKPEAHGGWMEGPIAGRRGLPDEALKAFPMVEEIMTNRIVRHL